MTRIITGLFDSRSEAEAVVEHLVQHHDVNRAHVRIHHAEAGAAAAPDTRDKGFLASLSELFLPSTDRQTYAEGIRRGGYVVTAEVDEALVGHVTEVFEQHGAVDLDAREAEWRAGGWDVYGGDAVLPDTDGRKHTGIGASTGPAPAATAGYGAASAGAAPLMTTPPVEVTTRTSDTATTGTAAFGTGAAASATPARTEDEEVIPVVEEQLRVAKRAAEGGRVRVRSYVVETPVNEQVTLREEHVDVQRRPVDRPVTAADEVFRDRTIEAVEHTEEAVVSKDARVTEELVIRKSAEERVETVSDTVRRTEVEVEDERGTTRPARPL